MPDESQSTLSTAAAPPLSSTSTLVAPSSSAGKPPVAQPASVTDAGIALDQFAIELSHRDKRVELLNAFVFSERRLGHFKDIKANYQARFEAFADQPA